MKELDCPYVTAYHVGNSPAFVGRVDILREVLHMLSIPKTNSILLYGQRRIGKSSMLHELEKKLCEKGTYYPVIFDLQDKANVSLDDVLEELADKISEVLEQNSPKKSMILQQTFRERWLPNVLKHLPANKSVVLLFDEFDALSAHNSEQAGSSFIPFLRSLLTPEYSTRLKIVFVMGRNIDEVNEEMLSLFKATYSRLISLLEQEETIQLIRLSEKDNSLNWQDDALKKVWQLTNGHPFLTQHLCRSIFQNIPVDEESREVTLEDVERNISRALESSKSSWEWLWNGLVSAEQRIMTSTLAEASNKLGNTNIITENQLNTLLENVGINETTIQKLLQNTLPLLRKWDLIEDDEDGYRFRVELLRRWFAKYKPLNRLQDDIAQMRDQKEEADIRYESGFDFYKANKLEAATTSLRQALLSNPFHKEANKLLAKIFLEEKRYKEAHEVLEHLYRLQPKAAQEQLISVLLTLAYASQDEQEQLKYYKRVLELDPNKPEAQIRWRELWQQRGNKRLGIKNEDDFEQALDDASEQVLDEALEDYREGKLYEPIKKIEAEQHRRTMLAGWYQQAKMALKNGDKSKAQQLFIQVITEKPSYGEASRYLHLAVTDTDPVELKNKTDQLQSDNERLQSDNKQLHSKNAQLFSEKEQLQSGNGQLQNEKEQLTGRIARLNKLFRWIGIGAFLIIVLLVIVFISYNKTLGNLLQKSQHLETQTQELKVELQSTKAQLQSTSEKLKVFEVIKNYKKFTVAVQQDFNPFSYLNEAGEREGFEIDIVREFARRWFGDEKAVILRPKKADYDIDSLIEHKANFVTSVLSTNKSEQLDVSVSYFQDNKRLLVRQDSDIKELCDIKGKRIAIVKGSMAKARLQIAEEVHQCGFQILEKTLKEFDSYAAALDALKKDKVEAMVASKAFLESFLKDKLSNSFKMVFFSIEEELYSFGVLKGNEQFLKLLNYTLQEMKADKTYAKIYCKWFGTKKAPYDFPWSGSLENEPALVGMVKAKLPSAFKECPKTGKNSYPIHYHVQKNDSLWDLAENFYGEPLYWKHIRDANQGQPVLIEGTRTGIREDEELLIPQPPE